MVVCGSLLKFFSGDLMYLNNYYRNFIQSKGSGLMTLKGFLLVIALYYQVRDSISVVYKQVFS